MFLPLELTLRPSRVYLLVLAVAHGLALAGIWAAALPVWIKPAAAVMLAAGTLWLWRESARSPRGLRVSQSGLVEVLDADWQPAGIRGRPVVLPWLVSLMLVPESGRARRLLLWADAVDADSFRRLRAWLGWGSLPRA